MSEGKWFYWCRVLNTSWIPKISPPIAVPVTRDPACPPSPIHVAQSFHSCPGSLFHVLQVFTQMSVSTWGPLLPVFDSLSKIVCSPTHVYFLASFPAGFSPHGCMLSDTFVLFTVYIPHGDASSCRTGIFFFFLCCSHLDPQCLEQCPALINAESIFVEWVNFWNIGGLI